MRQKIKKIISIILALAMIVTGINFTPTTVKADDISFVANSKKYTFSVNDNSAIIGFVLDKVADKERVVTSWNTTENGSGVTKITVTAINNDNSKSTVLGTLVSGGLMGDLSDLLAYNDEENIPLTKLESLEVGSYTLTMTGTNSENEDKTVTYTLTIENNASENVTTEAATDETTENETTKSETDVTNKGTVVTTDIDKQGYYDEVSIDGHTYRNYANEKNNSHVTATASSEVRKASNVLNEVIGNGDSRWESNSTEAKSYITINLGQAVKFREIAIWWETASAKEYEIQISDTGSDGDWTTVQKYTNSGESRTDKITFNEELSAKYVRMNCNEKNTAYGYSVYSFAIYGVSSNPSNAVLKRNDEKKTVLTWKAPDSGAVEKYVIKVNDKEVAIASGTTYTFEDNFTFNDGDIVSVYSADESGNIISEYPANTTARPDLQIANVVANNAVVGEEVSFNVTFINVGVATAVPTKDTPITVTVTIYNVTSEIVKLYNADYSNKEVAVDEKVTLTTTTTTINASGIYQIKAEVDDRNAVTESDETNNTFDGNITIVESGSGLPSASLTNTDGIISLAWPENTEEDNTNGYKITYVTNGETKSVTVAKGETTYSFPDNVVLDNNTTVTIYAVAAENTEVAISDTKAVADLEIVEVSSNKFAVVGEETPVTVKYKNVGTAKATSATDQKVISIKLRVAEEDGDFNGKADWATKEDGLLPNASDEQTVDSLRIKRAGFISITAEVDDENRLKDPNLNNNKMTYTITAVDKDAAALSYDENSTTDSKVLLTWKKADNVDNYKIVYTTNGVERELSVKTVDAGVTYDEATNKYSMYVNDQLDNESSVYVYSVSGDTELLIGADEALADLIITEVGEPSVIGGDEVRIGYKFNINVTVKNVGTAQVLSAPDDAEGDTEKFYPYTIPMYVQWENADGTAKVLNDAYHKGLAVGNTQVFQMSEIAPTKAGNITFTFKADCITWGEADNNGFVKESNENNNTKEKVINVGAKRQIRTMDWTNLYDSENADTEYKFSIGNGSYNGVNVQYKILDTSCTDIDFADLATEYSGYGSSWVAMKFKTDVKVIESKKDADINGGKTYSYSTVDFAQTTENVINSYSEDSTINYTTLAVPGVDILDNKNNDVIVANSDQSPLVYNGNGFNFNASSFAPGKYYIFKIKSNVDNNYITMALRVPNSTGAWIQVKANDNTNINALPFYYHKAEADYITTGGFYYNGEDLGLAVISAYNNDHLSLTTDTSKPLSQNGNWRIDIATATYDQNGVFSAAGDYISVKQQSEVFGIQGTNTLLLKLPDLMKELPIHSDKGGQKDDEYYIMKVYPDTEKNPEYCINIPVMIRADIPKIQPIKDLTASFRGDDIGISWSNKGLDDYTYKVYIDGKLAEANEDGTYTGYSQDISHTIKVVAKWCEQTTENTIELKTDLGDAKDGVEPKKDFDENKWVLISGENLLPVMNNDGDKEIKANIYYYTDEDISDVVGYNGSYIAINGNEKYFSGKDTQLFVQKDGLSETERKLVPKRIYDKMFAGQLQINSTKMFETYGEWKIGDELFYTVRIYGDDNTYKDFYFKIVPSEKEIEVDDKAEWVKVKGLSTIPVSFVYSYDTTDNSGLPITVTEKLEMSGEIEYYDAQSLTNTYSVTGYNGYYMSILGKNDVFSGKNTVKMEIANTGITDNAGMLSNGYEEAAKQTYNDGNIYDQLYPGEVQLNVPQTFTVTHTLTYFMLKFTGHDGTVKYLPIRITVKPGNMEIMGYQMNTNSESGAVSEFNPSFRVMSRTSKVFADDSTKLHGVKNYGTVYALKNSVKQSDDMVLNSANKNIMFYQADDEGTYDKWLYGDEEENSLYYALTFKYLGYKYSSLTTNYTFRAYVVLDDGEIRYSDVDGYSNDVNMFNIAKALYDGKRMSTEKAHDFLYNNILNLVTMDSNRKVIARAMMDTLNITSKESEWYKEVNQLYNDISYYARCQGDYKYETRKNGGFYTSFDSTDLLKALNAEKGSTCTSLEDWIYAYAKDALYAKVELNSSDDTYVTK